MTVVDDKPNIRTKIRDHKTALIQEEILSAAARLIAERGFRAVTVDDISGEMGFTKSIVYYYMKNKNEILWRIFSNILDTYDRTLDEAISGPESIDEKLSSVIRMHCLNVLSHPNWSTIYNRDGNELTDEQRILTDKRKHAYNSRIAALYAEGVKTGVFRDIPPTLAVSCFIGACNWAYTWFKPSGRMSAEEISGMYANQLLRGILA